MTNIDATLISDISKKMAIFIISFNEESVLSIQDFDQCSARDSCRSCQFYTYLAVPHNINALSNPAVCSLNLQK
jgi:hypothetical protein